ncbi:NADAR family protein [Streptomyces sp. DSM 44915]|uniref:NADAR family protein n=1 Tax=Streptomyces chisholmiae TaxID=3075540 RepID=A0ABU2JTI2_9ACTN|nr:NADAR family protein [Streptomyces sp. DSM 44915]MDT0268044.1 NADAR family protein [Streptomyces sp. DSM 44915]
MAATDPPPTDLAELCRWEQAGRRLKYLCFWGHRPGRGDGPGPWCLSQWWPAPFTIEGVRYATAEHYMMVSKARLFEDHAAVPRILAAASPGEAKALGRRVTGFDETTWRTYRSGIVFRASLEKFGQDARLRAYLLGTAGRVLVEASPVDRVWGIGLPADDPRATSPSRWRGENLLGFALMRARTALAGADPGDA